MSMFTEWNGPPGGRGPNTKDVLALIDAYNRLSSVLSKHLESTASDNVHSFDTALGEAVSGLESEVKAALALKADSEDVSAVSDTASASEKEIMLESSRAVAAEAQLQSAVDSEASRAQESEAALAEAISALESALEETKETFSQALGQIGFDDDVTTTVSGALAATEYVIGMVKVRALADFIEWETITARYAGTGSYADARTHGIYILGQLSEEWDPDKEFSDEYRPKAARAYIKYIGNRPFDLIADISASGLANGTIECSASFNKVWTKDDPDDAWEDMALHLLLSKDSSGSQHLYLGISARGLYGQPVQFHVAGVNFIAGGTANGISSSVGFVRVRQGFNAYRANFDDLRVSELHDVHGDVILRVSLYSTKEYYAIKSLYIADKSYDYVYFLRRPSVIIDEEQDDGSITSYTAPVLTGYDLDALSAGSSMKGIIVLWPQWEDAVVDGVSVKRAVNVPEGWIACDGSTVSTSEYPMLIEILGLADGAASAALPCMDYAIMRLYNLFDNVELSDGSKATQVMSHAELQAAVQDLQDNLVEEAETREAADIALQAAIDQEAADRTEADAVLQAAIDQEAADRTEADAVLQAAIDAEAQARSESDSNLQANINIETNERIAADEQLQAGIDAEAQARQDADAVLQAAIDAEAQARQDADAVLQAGIDAEAQARQDADDALQAALDQEASDRSAADSALDAKIDQEISDRKDADSALESLIDAETTARREADTALQSAVDAEIVARREADAQLQSLIDQEAASRIMVDTAQQGAIDTLDATKAESWTGTQSEFDAAKDGLEDGTIVLSDEELEDT